MGSRRRAGITAAVVALLLAPVALDRDGIPLSTYPMYARQRDDTVSFLTARGRTAAGESVRLSPQTIGRSDDPLVVVGELGAALRAGRTDERCAQIAERVSSASDASVVTVVAVQIVTERHDMLARLRNDASLVGETVHAECSP